MSTPKFNPKTSILLLLDFQVIHTNMLPNAENLLARTASLIALARQKGIKIAHIRMAFTTLESASIPSTNKTLSGLASNPTYVASYLSDAPSSAFNAAVAPDEEKGDIVLRKNRVGPFFNSPGTLDLDTRLRDMGIETLIIGGISTGGAVLATVVQATDLDYRICVVEDLCDDRDRELHEVLVEKIFKKRGWVVQSKEVEGLTEN